MRKTKKSKLLSLILCMSLIVSTFAFMPQIAAADDSAAPTDATQQAADSAEPGDNAADTQSDSNADDEQATDSNADSGETTQAVVKTVDFTNAAPLLDPVVGKASKAKKAKAAKSAKAANESTGTERVDNDGVVTSKTVTKNEDGTYKIRLESYVTGATTTTTVTEDVPTDIVLVLDQSGSMADPFGYDYKEITKQKNNNSYYDKANTVIGSANLWYKLGSGEEAEYVAVNVARDWGTYTYTYTKDGVTHTIGTSTGRNTDPGYKFYTREDSETTKLEALQEAVTSFCDSVAEKAKGADKTLTDDDVNHRIAIVGFGSGDESKDYYYTNTELFNGSTQIRYDGLEESYYKNAFKDMNKTSGVSDVRASIGKLDAKGATRADLGMDMAKSILDANPLVSGEKRNRVVIMFTDGSPTSSDGFKLDVANTAIKNANEIKDAGATVYSVGIFDGANAELAGEKPEKDIDTDWWGNITDPVAFVNACNWFMQNVSSNNGNPQDPSYYLSASNSATLNKIFEEISSQIETGGASVKLDSTTVVKDIVSDYFELPEGTTADKITLKTAEFDGYKDDGKTAKWKDEGTAEGVTASIDNKTVNVTGFDFSENYVGIDKKDGKETARGKKLIIEFDVKVRDGFLGGNGVPTNGADSGIYTTKDGKEETVENFEQPTVNVPVSEITAAATDKNVYLDGSLSASDIKAGITVKAGNVELELAEDNYGLEAWQNAFVDISVTAKDKAGNDIFATDYTGMNNLTDDNSYTVSASIKAKSGTGEKKDSAEGKINVFKPELTYKDSTVYYGGTAPENYDGNKVSGPVWKHGNTEAKGVTMIGEAPTLDISYSPAIGNETYYKGGKISTKNDIPVKVTVKIGGEDVTKHVSFKHTACDPNCGFDPEKEQFLIHVKTCSLKVTKAGGVKDEPYVMNIYKDDKFYTSMTIVGNTSEIVKELPVGTYTVQEDTKWAWRYNNTPNISGGVTLSSGTNTGTITVENHGRFGSFLNGYSTVVKNVFGQSKSN